MNPQHKPSMSEFFNWRSHPFTDTYTLDQPFMGSRDARLMARCLSLLRCGKSFAVTGASGTGKSTLVSRLTAALDANYYRPTLVPYGGLQRSGILRAVADELGVDPAGRAVPLLVKLQKHIAAMAGEANARYPVFVVDDAQLMERESMMDLCAMMVSAQKKTAAASLILVGDEILANTLKLHALTPVRTRLTGTFAMAQLDEAESRDFIAFRLEQAKAPPNLFETDAIDMITSHCRGNRRQIMNVATLLLDEAYHRQEKTVGSQLILSCDLLDISG